VINWTDVGFSTIWIFGASIILATFSYLYWVSTVSKQSLREQMKRPGYQQPLWIGLVLIAVGMAGTSSRTWEAVVWIILALLGSVNLWHVTQSLRGS
jgi:hypothetical protein